MRLFLECWLWKLNQLIRGCDLRTLRITHKEEFTLGLGFQTKASLKKQRAFGLLTSLISGEDVTSAFENCAINTPLQPLAKSWRTQNEGGFAVNFHPAAEPVYIDVTGDEVTVSTKTSNVGPGYHAFLVGCMDEVQKALGLQWQWDDADEGEYLDEAEFYESRNFSDLQHRMADHFRFLFGVVSERLQSSNTSGMMISMPLNYGVQAEDGEVLTPFGPMTTDEVGRSANLSGSELIDAARAYFPWWGQGFDGSFYRGLALFSLWMEQRWCAPVEDREHARVRQTLHWCEEARNMNAEPPLPSKAIEELSNLAEGRLSLGFPERLGIGYRRRPMTKQLTGNWKVSVPGSLEETSEDNHQTVVFWNDDFVVRGSSLSAASKEDSDQKPSGADSGLEQKSEFREAGDGDGFELEVVTETYSSTGSKEVCILTVWMASEKYRKLAEEIGSSISFEQKNRNE